MTAYSVTTKILIIDGNDTNPDTVAGSAAKAVSDYINGLANTVTIRVIGTFPVSNSKIGVMIVTGS